jgi:NAD(P)-dependent dehydrogenase (short-subunit alcohol dehydrogenase family)
MSLEGSTAIVTGGAVGLGRSFAVALGRAGAAVTICDTRPDVEQTAAELRGDGLEVEGVVADVSRPEDVRRVVDGVVRKAGAVDILVNNAGVIRETEPTDAWDKALDDFDYVMGTNLKGVFLFGRAVAPLMVAKGAGNIVNIATDHIHTCGWPDPVGHADSPTCPWAGERRGPGWVSLDVYDASKWGLIGLTQNWARSLRQHGVRVNTLCMGATDSFMLRSFFGYGYDESNKPPADVLAKWMDAEEVAQVLVAIIAEGPEGRSGDSIGLWIGHPTVLPPPSPILNIEPGFTPDSLTAPMAAYFA